jgi:hypothetical protein
MSHHTLKKMIARVLLSGAVAVSGFWLPAATAQAWPGCPAAPPAPGGPLGPCHWCPGDPPVQTGNLRVDPVRWDPNVCHTYWMGVYPNGNVAKTIWEGDEPPPPPPPPPPGLNFCPVPPWCP